MAFLTLFGPEPGAIGRVVPLGEGDEGDVTLGRDPASSLVLDHREISRRHATIRRAPSGWEIHDLGSSNGIRIQGHRMEAALLTDEDEIRIGPFRIVFSAGPAAAPLAPRRRPPPPPFPSPEPPAPQPGRTRPRGAPRSPSNAPKGRAGVFFAGIAILALVPAAVAGFVFFSGPPTPAAGPAASVAGPVEPTPATPLLPDEPLPPAAAWPPPPDPAVKAEVDRAAASLEAALAAGKVEEAFVHVHPEATAGLRAAFEPHRAELPRVARLLATRRLVVAEEDWAEYEVTEDGRTFAVVFEKVEGRWLLSSL